MKNVKLGKVWDTLHSSYWFIPSIMAILTTALAFIMLMLDRTGKAGINYWWSYTGGADGARSVLGAVAGSMISVAATAFSITIVALQLAASNFGPRLLRNFMQDTGNQIVLGTFISTFIYCLLILRTIHGEGDGYSQFVPQISVTCGILLAIISIGVLIYFIDHASTIIQASHIIENVSDDLDRAIDRLFPKKIGRSIPFGEEIAEIPEDFDLVASPVKVNRNGYVQAIDDQELLTIARRNNLLLRVESRPGKFIVKDSDLVMVFPGKFVNKKLTKEINDCFILGKERSEQQDIEFPIDQLVEIALRALSPGINDPFTAIRCVDRLGAGLSRLAQKDFPSPYRYDEDHKLRAIAFGATFEGLVNSAFNGIRQYARSDTSVTIRLLEAIENIATYTNNPKYQVVLQRHAEMILRGSQEGLPEELDRQDVQKQYESTIQALKNHTLAERKK
ncbi:hypothetical protein NIES4075_69070 [Tolypothrix sp. NIES-4075]|uniref:DUF2254 domain-containing protein n=1 Tax=Tolypothrix sp. NIES-4075 TaxID=2005459 RepID=UPI000B5CA1D8|nr:DUF2254 domain-containing protein [Tolypothrix sp. NIES-4075]GAX45886.1 hypothetical protein NIES4075_69070 [Tolypothrix sp. NIES-4075]